jgi:phosphoribulokinase
MAERGWTLDQVKAEIEKRKPDFDKFVAPQKQVADAVIQVLPTALTNGTSLFSTLVGTRAQGCCRM